MSVSCPECGKPVGPNALAGLCPECLMKVGLGSELQPGASAPGGPAPGKPETFVPPTPEELAFKFPQLEVLGLVGQGGMGAVYKARQKPLNRLVALKILPPAVGRDPAFAERFTREAQALAQLNHPGIVTLYEFGRANGLFYFLMELVEGVNLRQLLSAGRVSAREALAIVPQICDALQYAHDQGVIHRDIKPENILLDRRGRVKVADFGVAKLLGDGSGPAGAPEAAAGAVALTEAGKVLGTPRYMAPEQIERPAEVDHRADIYALGVVFYQMLTGELPGKVIEPPSKKVQVDVRLDEVVLRALEKKPELRFQQVSEVKTCVETILETTTAQPASASTQAGPTTGPSVRHLSRAAAAGLLWLGLFFLNWIISYTPPGWAITNAVRRTSLAGAIELVIFLPLTVLGFSALAGSTALGIVALREIRQSRGERYGVGLAMFDGLFFPLLFLNGWMVWLARRVLSDMQQAGAAAGAGWSAPVWVMVLLALILLGLNGACIRVAWRMANKFVATPPPPPRARVTGPWGTVCKQAGLRLVLVLIVQLALMETLNQVSLHWKESTGELWGMALMVATLGGMVWASWPGYRLKRSWAFCVGATVASGFLLLALDNLYAWQLRPNLGLYREGDWVVENAGFQKQFRLGGAKHIWRRTLVSPSFNPVREASLSLDGTHPSRLVDLDTGKEVSWSSFTPDDVPGRASLDGLDVMAVMKDGRFTALGFGLAVSPGSDHDWQAASPQDVADYFLLEWDRPKASIVLWPVAEYWYQERSGGRQNAPRAAAAGSLGTFFFRTREGAMGVLQFDVPDDTSGGAKMRYKLVPSAGRAASSGLTSK